MRIPTKTESEIKADAVFAATKEAIISKFDASFSMSPFPEVNGIKFISFFEKSYEDVENFSVEKFAQAWVDLFLKERDVIESRTYIEVAYAEKDKVKALGAKWDAERKFWYDESGKIEGYAKLFVRFVEHPALRNKYIEKLSDDEGFTARHFLLAKEEA